MIGKGRVRLQNLKRERANIVSSTEFTGKNGLESVKENVGRGTIRWCLCVVDAENINVETILKASW